MGETDSAFNHCFNFHIQRNGMPTVHTHEGYCEFIFILSGGIEHSLNGKTSIINQNSLIFITQSDSHTLKKVTEDSYYACLGIQVEHFRNLLNWISPDFADKLMQSSVTVELTEQEARETSEITEKTLVTATVDRYYEILHLLTMTFVNKIAVRLETPPPLQTHHPAVLSFIRFIETPKNLSLSLDDILDAINYSYPHINRLFKNEMGCSVGQYLQNRKMIYAKKLLAYTDNPLSYISSALGFSGCSHFSLAFKNHENCSPSQYRNQHFRPQ